MGKIKEFFGKINWKVRVKNKTFWLSLIPLVFVFATNVAALFGVEIDLSGISQQLLDIIEVVFVILGILGIVNDPTTAGLSDSALARTYTEPKADK